MTPDEHHPRTRRALAVVVPGAVLVVVGLLVFAKMLDDVRESDDLAAVDQTVLEWLVAHRSPWVTSVLQAITFVTGPTVLPVVVLVACVVWWRVRRVWWRPALLAGAMVVSTALGLLVKGIVARPRPPVETMHVPGAETTASFPSGHTLGTATFLLVAGYLVCSRHRSVGLVAVWLLAAVVGTGLVALSRLYLGYHFLTDVLAAVGLAVVVLGLVTVVDRWRTLPASGALDVPVLPVVPRDG
ncbi:phosphatase PAP2 family protein [Cellulomonas sp. HZM]|uniref:phosphatase PAP2 family protein n=1 Tax=Cellulomonas sp. HZM TaxID=1454010 RepID=UPI000691ABCD|nr:phosphatase PAP2 family protein [Cellulomonas sp. HZM]